MFNRQFTLPRHDRYWRLTPLLVNFRCFRPAFRQNCQITKCPWGLSFISGLFGVGDINGYRQTQFLLWLAVPLLFHWAVVPWITWLLWVSNGPIRGWAHSDALDKECPERAVDAVDILLNIKELRGTFQRRLSGKVWYGWDTCHMHSFCIFYLID